MKLGGRGHEGLSLADEPRRQKDEGGTIYSALRLPQLYDGLNVCTVNWVA